MLSTPPAFILSQDQTLLLIVCPVKINSSCLIFPVLLGFVLNSSRTQGRIPSPLFFEFSGSVYCSIFNSQGSVLLSFSATAYLLYHAVFDLSTTFFKFFSKLFCFATLLELADRCISGARIIIPPLSTKVNTFFHFFKTIFKTTIYPLFFWLSLHFVVTYSSLFF